MVYNQQHNDVQEALDKSRSKEFGSWEPFDAVLLMRHDDASALIKKGVSVVLTQWIEVDQRLHLQIGGTTDYRPLYKRTSKLAARLHMPIGTNVHLVCDIGLTKRDLLGKG